MTTSRATFLTTLLPHLLLLNTVLPCPQLFITSSTTVSGNISSPNYPNPYPAKADCTYILQGNDYQGMKITFLDFDLESPYTAGCLSDYVDLDIYDTRERITFHTRFCGNVLPTPLLVLHPKAKIVFRSNHAVNRRGFAAKFEFIDESEVTPPKTNATQFCGEFPTGGSGGVIQFPGTRAKSLLGHGPVHGPIDCLWLIRVARNHKIHARIQELEFHGSIENCHRAQLGIYDGYEHALDETTVLKKFCGDKHHYKGEDDRGILSARNRLLVRFTSSAVESLESSSNFGFRIVWSEVSPDETSGDCTKKNRFPCKETRACITKDHLGTFSTCPQLIYCISNDLVCDGIPHCSEGEASDERACYGRVVNVLLVVVPVALLSFVTLAFATFLIKRKHMLKKVSATAGLWKKEKTINSYVLEAPNRSGGEPFASSISVLEPLNTMMDSSSFESASICPLSDSESSEVSICPFHGHKFMSHLPVLHEVYNIDSDDSSTITGLENALCPHICHDGGQPDPNNTLSASPTRMHAWRLKNTPIQRSNAVCLSDECKSSSGDESPCLCKGMAMLNLTSMIHNDKVEDSGVELPDSSFDLHFNIPQHLITISDNDKQHSDLIMSLPPFPLTASTDKSIQTEVTCPIIYEPSFSRRDHYFYQPEVRTATTSTQIKFPVRRQTSAIGTQTSRQMFPTSYSNVTTFGVFPESTSTDV